MHHLNKINKEFHPQQITPQQINCLVNYKQNLLQQIRTLTIETQRDKAQNIFHKSRTDQHIKIMQYSLNYYKKDHISKQQQCISVNRDKEMVEDHNIICLQKLKNAIETQQDLLKISNNLNWQGKQLTKQLQIIYEKMTKIKDQLENNLNTLNQINKQKADMQYQIQSKKSKNEQLAKNQQNLQQIITKMKQNKAQLTHKHVKNKQNRNKIENQYREIKQNIVKMDNEGQQLANKSLDLAYQIRNQDKKFECMWQQQKLLENQLENVKYELNLQYQDMDQLGQEVRKLEMSKKQGVEYLEKVNNYLRELHQSNCTLSYGLEAYRKRDHIQVLNMANRVDPNNKMLKYTNQILQNQVTQSKLTNESMLDYNRLSIDVAHAKELVRQKQTANVIEKLDKTFPVEDASRLSVVESIKSSRSNKIPQDITEILNRYTYTYPRADEQDLETIHSTNSDWKTKNPQKYSSNIFARKVDDELKKSKV